jgi:hypothetical protein
MHKLFSTMGVQSLSLMYDIFEREDFNIMFQGEELSAKFSPWQLARAPVFSVTQSTSYLILVILVIEV